jgi:predicted Ser/Thr protein kinase
MLAAGLESAASIPAAGDAPGAEPGAAAGPAPADPAARPLPTAPSPEEIGKHFPQLEVLELLGQGGMGIVYKARQKSLERLVALKVMPPEAAREAGFADRFSREARTLARLQHPNIVGVHDFGVSDGLYYLLMEYVDGANLRRAMREGKLTPAQALAIVPQICDALQYAHENGVVHRDVKPENILLDRAGRVRIADFGLAKIVQRTAVDVTLTRAGQVMGTLHYMAPEQLRTPDAVDHRADIYSLGVVFYEMLTGELPLGSFPPPSEKAHTDARLDRVVMRALEGERERRWQHASDVKDGVSAIASGVAAPAPMAAPAPAAAAPAVVARPSRLATAGGLGVPAAIVLGLAVWLTAGAFGGGEWAGEAAAAVATLVLFAGWVTSIFAWARIHHSAGALGGKSWAVTGTFLPLAFLCCGGPFLAMPSMSVKEGPDGTHVKMPFLDVREGADGTHVKMPGIEVHETGGGTSVRIPGVEVEEKDGRTRVRVSSVAVSLEERNESLHVTGGPLSLGDSDRAALVATVRELWDLAGAATARKAELGLTSAEGFRFFHLALDADGKRGRAVLTDGTWTVAVVLASSDGLWELLAEDAEVRAGAASEPDRDGRLRR